MVSTRRLSWTAETPSRVKPFTPGEENKVTTSQKRLLGCAFLFATFLSMPAFAGTISWTTWTAQPTSTTADGTLLVGSTPVSVTYAGEIAFTQLNGIGTDFYQPSTTFTDPPIVPNAPDSDMIAIDGTATTHTVTFGAAVVNPIMEIVSLGNVGVPTQYAFSLASGQSMSLLTQGPSNAFGGCDTCLSLSGTTLTGHEGDGIIQFTGTFTSLTWTGADPEFWNGFTFGVTGLAVPEPATWALIAIPLVGLAAGLRRQA